MDNSFASVHPELVGEWSERNTQLSPDKVTYGSNKIVWWKASCGHEWQASLKSRSAGESCPICSGKRVVPGINDLSTLKPRLVQEWSDLNEIKPTEVGVGSHKKILWHGVCGHEWTASVKSRVNGSGCPYCSHNKVLAGFNDLASRYPDVVAEWSDRNAPLQPTEVTAFANRKVWWRCREGHEWHTLISTRSGGSKCPYCSGIRLLTGFNDLATRYPRLADEWSGKNEPLMPNMINEKSRKNIWWHCKKCGFEWKAVVYSRVRGSGCPVCADRQIMSGYNDLATTNPHLLSEWDYEKNTTISPEMVSANSLKSVWWRCGCGHSWKEKIQKRVFEGEGCKVCEHEFQSVLPQLAIKYYAERNGLRTRFYAAEVIGLPLDAYIPEERLAISVHTETEAMERVKEYLCRQRGIRYIKMPYRNRRDVSGYMHDIMTVFQIAHIYFSTDVDRDLVYIRTRFMEWRIKQKPLQTGG